MPSNLCTLPWAIFSLADRGRMSSSQCLMSGRPPSRSFSGASSLLARGLYHERKEVCGLLVTRLSWWRRLTTKTAEAIGTLTQLLTWIRAWPEPCTACVADSARMPVNSSRGLRHDHSPPQPKDLGPTSAEKNRMSRKRDNARSLSAVNTGCDGIALGRAHAVQGLTRRDVGTRYKQLRVSPGNSRRWRPDVCRSRPGRRRPRSTSVYRMLGYEVPVHFGFEAILARPTLTKQGRAP